MKQTLDFLKNHTTLILAVVSGYLYLCTYFFESGYLKVFDIPNNYSSIDLNVILSDSSQIIKLVFILIFIYQIVKLPLRKWMSKSELNEYIGGTLSFSASLIFFARSATLILNSLVKYMFFTWVIALILLVLYFIIKFFNKSSKNNKIESNINEENQSLKPTFLLHYDKYFLTIAFICFPVFICEFIGEGTADKLTEFSMINDSTKYIVIRKYGDQLICKDYDYVNKKFGKQIIIVKVPINKPIVLVNYGVGNYYERKFSKNSIVSDKPKLKFIPSKKIKSDTLNNQNLGR